MWTLNLCREAYCGGGGGEKLRKEEELIGIRRAAYKVETKMSYREARGTKRLMNLLNNTAMVMNVFVGFFVQPFGPQSTNRAGERSVVSVEGNALVSSL